MAKLTLFDYEFYCQKDDLLLAECIAKTALEIAELDATGLELVNRAVDL